jgi:hypothetical protein
MKKLALMTLFFALMSVSLIAQKEYGLDDFDELVVTGNVEVILEKGATNKISFRVENAEEGDLYAGVSRGALKIKLNDGLYKKDEKAYVTLTYQTLRTIKSNAGSYITSREAITIDKLVTKAHSGSRIELELNVNAVQGGAYEGGVLELSGIAESQKMKANTGGIYEGFELECERSFIKASTGGEARVVANQKLDARASLGGVIEYRGQPEELSQSTSLGGSISY